MLHYFGICAVLGFLVVWVGWVGPFCISSTSTELLVGYFVLSIILAPLIFVILFKIIKGVRVKLAKFLLLAFVAAGILGGCTKVPAGNVGIKFYLLGQKKGVDCEELSPGRYFVGWNEELYLFPTFTQNYVWTSDAQEGSPTDESFNFQDRQGLELNADIGITYHLDPTKITSIFQKYKRGIAEITDIFLRNMVRDALVTRASKLDVEYIYGEGRSGVIDSVTIDINRLCNPLGIMVDKIYWIGRIKLPKVVKEAIDDKIQATQVAQKRENELREAEAAAKKVIAEAEGLSKSRLMIAEAEAKANKVLSASLTPALVNYKAIDKWNGVLPQVSGTNTPFVSLGTK